METQRGLQVSTNSIEVIQSINHFHHQIVGSGKFAEDILSAAEHHPDNLLIQTYAAAFYLYAQENVTTNLAAAHLLKAEKQLPKANLREQLSYQAVHSWLRLDYQAALNLFSALTELFPRDTLAAKFAEWLFYCSGQVYQSQRFLAFCEKMAKYNQDESHFLAIHAFALQLSGKHKASMALAERAIDMELITPWAHHCLAHAYLFESDLGGGIACLRRFQSSWEQILPLLKGHNSWHLALFYLANRDETEVLALFNQGIFGTLPETALEQLDAISLLWRMDMAGMPQDNLFKSIANYLGVHPFEPYTGFNSAHFIYCLARAGEKKQVEKALKAIQSYANSLAEGYSRELWLTVNLPFCKAISYFVESDHQNVCKLLSPIIDSCFQMGGSDAQDELFTQTYLLSLLGCKKKDEAKRVFTNYLAHYENTALADYWFSGLI
ncbi:hypothetical protein BN59_02620 [Legionella massiliensis]|uniref:Tetratricopeptide repeat protein 38 n=1 Tax=Legionella massiliensis TaxID=1034943 RepID=A0A078KV45_9GAMM|nr:hypothetical protein [Legionella massiliensis]CDZ78310.1 hypothetical protein BN59_02620 [Legionella massiliensis]CEE14048.1 hypothetical protein BN1094_02620 [Legionella massiliensis]